MARKQMYRLRPIAEREFLFSHREMAELMGIKRDSFVERYAKKYPDCPRPPTTKNAVWAFLRRHGITQRLGPRPHMSDQRRRIVTLRLEGVTFREIGELCGVSKDTARDHWLEYKKQLKLDPNYGKENNAETTRTDEL